MYWWPRYRYAEHLLFFVHLHAFYFSLAIVMLALINAGDAWPKVDGVTGTLETILGWTIPVYTPDGDAEGSGGAGLVPCSRPSRFSSST